MARKGLGLHGATVALKVGTLQPDDISPGAVFLGSDEANMVIGAEYEVTAGDSAQKYLRENSLVVSMALRLHYGTTAKVLHWLVIGLLLVQYPIGWLMPDIHRGQQPGMGMTFHISLGITILFVIVLRLLWRLSHPVAPESTLPPWQRLSSELVHWMLCVLVLATTLSGWLFASFRGWTVSYFYLVPLPMLAAGNAAAVKAIDGLHQAAEWTLLALIGLHVLAALAHMFLYRDRIMERMLPG